MVVASVATDPLSSTRFDSPPSKVTASITGASFVPTMVTTISRVTAPVPSSTDTS